MKDLCKCFIKYYYKNYKSLRLVELCNWKGIWNSYYRGIMGVICMCNILLFYILIIIKII